MMTLLFHKKSLFLQTFPWVYSLVSNLKEWKQFRKWKLPLFVEVVLYNNADNIFTAR